MKFKEDRPHGNPQAALARLLAIANELEADHAGRLSVAIINRAFAKYWRQLRGIQRGGQGRHRARLAHHRPVWRLLVVHASRGRKLFA